MKKTVFSILGCGLIVVVSLFTLVIPGCSGGPKTNYEPGNAAPRLNSPLVVSRHQLAREAGYRVLNSGGNAFDAFVAVTLVENVVSSGYVTLAGLLSVMLYHAETNQVMHLDGGFNSVLDPAGLYDPRNPSEGKKIVVPGVIAGLEAISKRYGRLSFAKVVQPAIEIAGNGFVIDKVFSYYINYDPDKLQRSEYGRRTFFPNGTALQPGDILKQPELAEFLTKLAEQGANYMYRGEWAEQCVETVQRQGGLMTLKDLAAYQPAWAKPWKISYRGYDICASSGRTMYALWTLLALKILEHTAVQPLGHFSLSADALEILVRVTQAVYKEKWLRDYRSLDNRELVNSRLTSNYAAGIWARVKQELNRVHQGEALEPPCHHTLSSIVADREGNVVSGKHSINSELWGPGLFVQGIPLNGSGDLMGRFTGPGKRRTQGAPNFFVFKNGILKYACGTFSFSNPQAALQFLVNLLDYGLPAGQAASFPRFGSYPYDMKTDRVDFSKYELDERVSREVVEILEKRGLFFSQKRPKLGKGCIAEFHIDGTTTTGWDWGK